MEHRVIWQIVKKDWKLLWPMVALVTAIQVGFEWAVYSAGLFGEDPAAAALLRPLTLAWFVGIVALVAAVVHQDAIPGVDQDWLIRPLIRTQLLLAKLAFVALGISVPMFVSNLADALATGFSLVPSLEAAFFKDLFVYACFVVPVMALAATTRNMTELVVIGAALVVAFSSSLSLSAFLFGADWCPTCNTGMSWLQHLVQHGGVLAGAGVILGLQYYRRRSDIARALALAGAVALVFAQLPWSTAFDIERWMTGAGMGGDAGARGAAAGILLDVGENVPDGADATSVESMTSATGVRSAASAPGTGTSTGAGAGGKGPDSRQTTQMVLHGRVDQAVDYWRRRARPVNAPVGLEVPVRVRMPTTGAPADALLLADRVEIHLFGNDGRLLYRGDNAGALATLLTPYPGRSGPSPEAIYQTVDVPGRVYRAAAQTPVRLQLDYSLTLMKVVAEHELTAINGELQSNDIGFCATLVDRNAAYLRCKTIDQAPFCYSATLYGSGGRHNPEVLKCTPDYRRHLPAFMHVLSLYGVDMPLRDRNGVVNYEIDASSLGEAHVLFKVYGESEHFERRLASAVSGLEGWRAQTQ